MENRSFDARDAGRGKTFVEPWCLSLIALADKTLSCASFETSFLLTGDDLPSEGCVGVNRALADLILRGLAAPELISIYIATGSAKIESVERLEVYTSSYSSIVVLQSTPAKVGRACAVNISCLVRAMYAA